MNDMVIGSPRLRLRLIGPMGLWTDQGQDLSPLAPRTRMILAAIGLCAPRAALKSQLARVIWPDLEPSAARNTLRREMRRVLDALGPDRAAVIAVSSERVWFHPERVSIDIDDVMRASAADPDALSLLDRELLEDLTGIEPAFDSWVDTCRERLRAHARSVAEKLLAPEAGAAAAIPAARRVLAIDPSHEGAWRALMLAQAGMGQPTIALRTYELCRDTFAERLGLTPSPETQALLPRLASGRDLLTLPDIGRHVAAAGAPARPEETLLEIMPLTPIGLDAARVEAGREIPGLMAEALSRFRWVTVVGPIAPDHGAGQALSIGPRADLRLQGTIQAHRAGIRVSLRLLDVRGGEQIIWAGRFEQSPDVVAWPRTIVAAAVGQIMTRTALYDRKISLGDDVQDHSAEVLMRRAVLLLPSMTRENFMRAGDLLSRAVARDPGHAAALAFHAAWHVMLVNQGWHPVPAGALARAGELADRALGLASDDALVLSLVAHVLARQPVPLTEAEALHQRAMEINPLAPIAWGLGALTAAYGGNVDEAARRFARYKSMSPHDPFAGTMDVAAPMIHMLRRDHGAVAAAGRAAVQISPFCAQGYRGYLSALGHMSHAKEAETVRARLLNLAPHFSIDTFLVTTPMRDSAGRDHYVKGLRLAGVT